MTVSPMPSARALLSSTMLAACLMAPGLAAPAFAQTAAGAPPAIAPAPVDTANPAKLVARVDGAPVTEGDLAVAAEDPILTLPGSDEKQKRDLLVGYVIDLKLGTKAAEAAKLGDTPDFKRKLAYMREKLLVDDYLERETKKAVTPEAARKLYEETVKAMPAEEEVRARHILVPTEEEAKTVETRLKAGEDFAKVAEEVSQDPGSKSAGGELGFFTKDKMIPAFAEQAFKMKPKEVSAPVKTQFGWHVIETEERRTKPVPPFEELKEQIDQYLTRKAQQDVVLALRKDAKIERLDEPAAAATPAAPEGKKP